MVIRSMEELFKLYKRTLSDLGFFCLIGSLEVAPYNFIKIELAIIGLLKKNLQNPKYI